MAFDLFFMQIRNMFIKNEFAVQSNFLSKIWFLTFSLAAYAEVFYFNISFFVYH